MMALERKESMQRNCEASIKCLQNNGIPFSLQHSGNSADGFQEISDEISCHGSNDIPETNHLLANNFIERPNEFHNKPAYQHNSGSWQAFHFDSQKVQQCQMSASECQFYSLPVENRFQYVPFKMFEQNYHCDRRLQEFQYFVVIDFEATCDKDRNPHPQEIIEFPSVIVSSVTGQLEACFQTYVRPTCNQLLSDFCRDLTGIQQIQVDRGVTLNEALLRHDKWLEKKGIKNTNFAVVTWSNWDCRVMLESECRFKKIRKPPYFNRSTASRYYPLWAFPFGLPLTKTRLLGEGFHTLINGGVFSSPTNVGHHNPPPFGAQRPRWHSFLPPIDVGPPPNPPPFGAQRPYWHTASCLPLRGTARRLAHRPMSGSDTISNDPDPPLADIVLFGLFLSGFPSRL